MAIVLFTPARLNIYIYLKEKRTACMNVSFHKGNDNCHVGVAQNLNPSFI
jgi:hypothetical protein